MTMEMERETIVTRSRWKQRAAGAVVGGLLALGTGYSFTRHLFSDENFRNIGLTITGLTATTYSWLRFVRPEGKFASEKREDLTTAAGIMAVAGLVIAGTPSVVNFGADHLFDKGSDETQQPTNPDDEVSTESTNYVTAPVGDQATPTGYPCEVYFPFNDPGHLDANIRLVQGGLTQLAVDTGNPAFDPNGVDGNQGPDTNAALIAFRESIGVPISEEFSLAQCSALRTLIDGDPTTPAIP